MKEYMTPEMRAMKAMEASARKRGNNEILFVGPLDTKPFVASLKRLWKEVDSDNWTTVVKDTQGELVLGYRADERKPAWIVSVYSSRNR